IAEHLIEAASFSGRESHADAHRALKIALIGVDGEVGPFLAYALRHLPGAVLGRTRKNHCEFLAAKPGRHIGRAKAGGRDGRETLQHMVAHRVSVAVIDTFELIQVEYEHTCETIHLNVLEAVEQCAAVKQSRKRVGHGVATMVASHTRLVKRE